MAGATTAVGGDAYAGASNPAKLLLAGNRVDAGLELFMPSRTVERSGSGTVYDFKSTSRNDVFPIPELAYSHQLSERLGWGVTLYGNGGLNTEYPDTTGVPGTAIGPACGNRPANFLLGCGKAGFDLTQLIAAPTVAWRPGETHTFGIAPLIALQRFRAYGLQALELVSRDPEHVTNQGYDYALGIGVRLGWHVAPTSWLSLGAAYATRVYMEDAERYKGLFADGSFDIPANLSLGVAIRPEARWLIAFDFQRIFHGDVNALGNGVLGSFLDPAGRPLGSARGSGFNWRNSNTYRFGIAYDISPSLTLRAGYAHGRRPNDESINSVTLNMLAPNPVQQVSAGLTWRLSPRHRLHIAASHFVEATYRGPSATRVLGIGGTESIKPHVETVMFAWTWLR